MGKILLGKQVPLVAVSQGTITTSENVKEAYAKDWGRQSDSMEESDNTGERRCDEHDKEIRRNRGRERIDNPNTL